MLKIKGGGQVAQVDSKIIIYAKLLSTALLSTVTRRRKLCSAKASAFVVLSARLSLEI